LTTQAIGIRQLAIRNVTTHPLPRGGTDLIGTAPIAIQMGKLHQYPKVASGKREAASGAIRRLPNWFGVAGLLRSSSCPRALHRKSPTGSKPS